ncbi:NAD(P)/FAD-dependent oxidoreductase [Zobellella endophytica]|nr:FAD-dependent oxidoreductase [Zobellella endophytica]
MPQHHTYPGYQRSCGWNDLLAKREPAPALEDSQRADVVVIGAGFTGMAAARYWARQRPDQSVYLLDASHVGEGSPGRNSGFLLEIALANDAATDQLLRMGEINRLSRQTVARLKLFIEEHAIDCQWRQSGTYRAAAGDAGMKSLTAYRTFLQAAGLEFEELSRAQLAERTGSAYYRAGLYSPDCTLVQPAALIRGLVDNRPGNISLFEHSPVTTLAHDHQHWRVTTPRGEVQARHVILANNAFSRHLGADPARLSVIYTYAALTAPLPDAVWQRLGAGCWGLLPAHRLGCTLRTTADRRLLIRSEYSFEQESDNDAVALKLQASLQRRYPDLALPFTHVWGGTTGFTHNGAPLWGEIGPRLHVAAGCNGGGVVKGTLLGELLARQALGETVPDIARLFGQASWMPPQPVRRLGFQLVSNWEKHRAKDER